MPLNSFNISVSPGKLIKQIEIHEQNQIRMD